LSHSPDDRHDGSESPSENTNLSRRFPLGAIVKFLVMLAVLVIAALALRYTPLSEFLTREKMVATLAELRLAWWSPLALIGLYIVLSPTGLPVSPLIFAGGVVFGVWWGWLYNFIGSLLGATSTYLLARALGRQLIEHVAGERLIAKVEHVLERHGFWNLVRSRFLPIPFAVINYGAALAGIRWPVFITASALGLAPSMVIWTYFGYAIFSVASEGRQAVIRNLLIALAVALTLTFLVPLRRAWKRRRYGPS
jgi:uncharacterized membrane protein YdjX (TVP38/TMEM64 family)